MKLLSVVADFVATRRSPYGERGLKLHVQPFNSTFPCRSPYGERGLKFVAVGKDVRLSRRSPYGERGLKYFLDFTVKKIDGRSPYGERGLKYKGLRILDLQAESLSLRRAWIEIRM